MATSSKNQQKSTTAARDKPRSNELWHIEKDRTKIARVGSWEDYPGDETSARQAREYLDENKIICGLFQTGDDFYELVLSSFAANMRAGINYGEMLFQEMERFKDPRGMAGAIEDTIEEMKFTVASYRETFGRATDDD